MGFAAEFDQWLSHLLLDFIGQNLAKTAHALTPVVVTLATLYLMVFGFLLLTGRVETPLLETFKRIAFIAGIFGVALHLWLYQPLIVDTFFTAPGQLAARFVGAFEPVTIVDSIIFTGGMLRNS
ncbi:MAG: type IV secretion system protein [Gammaproteobacteria bacterium]